MSDDSNKKFYFKRSEQLTEKELDFEVSRHLIISDFEIISLTLLHRLSFESVMHSPFLYE